MIPDSILNLNCFLIFDYSQIEIRMLAEVSGDPLLIRQFNIPPDKEHPWRSDVHCQVGHELTDWPAEKIYRDKDTRKLVKNFHFALVYGVAEKGLPDYMAAKGVTATAQQTSRFFRRYFKKYRGVKRWIGHIRRQGEEEGYVESLFGFRRDIRKDDEQRHTSPLNQSINTPIQSTAHQLVLIALALLDLKPRTFALLQNPIMEVHDALYFRTPLRTLKTAYQQGSQLLQRSVADYVLQHFHRKLKVPLVAEAKAGFCLGSPVDYAGQDLEQFLHEWRTKHKEVERTAWQKLLLAQ